MARKRYPIGVQTFKDIIQTGSVYVDKTEYIYRLTNQEGKFFFLSRPRRFGKSLLCSTLQAYFEGRRDLFRGLAMERLEQRWEQYPVLRADFSGENYNGMGALMSKLDYILSRWEDRYGRDTADATPGVRFMGAIRRAYEQTGQKVVVLIDEYDKPMLEALEYGETYDEYQKTMQGFYGALKSSDEYIRFCFLTGISKFGKLSVFSALNNLTDLSMLNDYAAICGITEQELHSYFDEDVQELAAANKMDSDTMYGLLRRKYDGYHFTFDSPGIYNPFSLLSTLSSRQIRDYWFATGTPTFLVSLLKRNNFDLEKLDENILASESTLWNISATSNIIPALYQSGYLTLKGYDADGNVYFLGFPNQEVANGFRHFLLPYYSGLTEDTQDGELYRMR